MESVSKDPPLFASKIKYFQTENVFVNMKRSPSMGNAKNNATLMLIGTMVYVFVFKDSH